MSDLGVSAAGVAELGQRLQAALGDSYAVEKPLGAGGFAVVFLVRDVQLKRPLAIKVLSPDLVTSKTVIERFKREAETVAQLSHPHIVPLHFVGQKDDLLYLAMQCVDGGSLADRIEKEGKLPVADVARYIAEIATALGHAHKRGVVHRDVKPQNVLLDAETGRCLVTDFGIARSAESASLTATGMVMGTPTYLAPEQVTGEPSDHRADIYALGIMAYEMLAGRPPFEGANATAVLMKRLAGPPESVLKVRADTPRELVDVIDGCLAADPNERFQNAGDIARALTGATPITGGQPTAEIVVKRRQKRQRTIIGGVVGAVAVAVAAWFALSSLRSNAPPTLAPVDSGMALIPAGSYVIGSNTGHPMTRPQHTVTLAAFGLDKHEVTVGEYKRFMDSTRSPAPWTGAMPRPSLPVTRVLWSEAARYCAARHADGGRLPSEEEWEAAARGAQGRLYPWGDRPEAARANTASARRKGIEPVGSFPQGASPEGVEDLIGNAWEWTSSPMKAYPRGDSTFDALQGYMVIRGGAFNTQDSVANAMRRGYNLPATNPDQLELTGFRCAMPARARNGGR